MEPNFKVRRIKLSPAEYKELCERVFTRDGWRCVMCGSANNLHAHHVKFRSQQGGDCLENLATLDWICHERAHRSKDFRVEVEARFKTIVS